MQKDKIGLFMISLTIMTLFMGGCASTFKPYPTQITPLIQQIDQPDEQFDKAVKDNIGKKAEGQDSVLYDMELGRLQQLRGKSQMSIELYNHAMETIEAREYQAKVNSKKLAAQVGSALTNDNAIRYEGYGYERVMLHQLQAFNYLELGDLDSALVEIRRATLEQDQALEAHTKDLARLEKEKEEALSKKDNAQKAKVGQLQKSFEAGLAEKFKLIDEVTAKIKNSFQNGYAYYLSGLLNQATQQLDNAYIDYKHAFELVPENSFLISDLMVLSRSLKRDSDEDQYARRLPNGRHISYPSKGEGELVIFFENGIIPQRKEQKLVLPNPGFNLSSVAFPYYPPPQQAPAPLRIKGKDFQDHAEPLCDIRGLAIKNTREQIPAQVTRQVIRILAKEGIAQVAENRLGFLGKIGANVYNTASEKADLRSWMTLPDQVQVFRKVLPQGKQTLQLDHHLTSSLSQEINITAGKITILKVTRIGDTLIPHVYDLDQNKMLALGSGKVEGN